MKKKFENIDDLTRFKINSLQDEDIEVNENLIWGKIISIIKNFLHFI